MITMDILLSSTFLLWTALLCMLSNQVQCFSFLGPRSSVVTFDLQSSWSLSPRRNIDSNKKLPSSSSLFLSSASKELGDWISLLPEEDNDFSVKKKILKAGEGDIPSNGNTAEIHYVGTLVGAGGGQLDWTAEDVVKCWLPCQQGMDGLAPTFLEAEIDGKKLFDDQFFTEDFIINTLGVSNKIQCKKLGMATRRIKKQQQEYADGMEFDSNVESEGNKPFSFVVGKKKVIQAMELAASTMKVGETAQVIARCDYAYGPEGLRKRNGDVMVPPFSTLCFEITLVNIE